MIFNENCSLQPSRGMITNYSCSFSVFFVCCCCFLCDFRIFAPCPASLAHACAMLVVSALHYASRGKFTLFFLSITGWSINLNRRINHNWLVICTWWRWWMLVDFPYFSFDFFYILYLNFLPRGPGWPRCYEFFVRKNRCISRSLRHHHHRQRTAKELSSLVYFDQKTNPG